MQQLLTKILFLTLFISVSHANSDKNSPILFTKAEVLNEYTTRIPFKLVDHLIVVEAQLFNQTGNFIIDTGSEHMILNKVHFQNIYEHQRKQLASSGVLQNVENIYQKQIKDFAIENFKLDNKPSDVFDLSHIEKSKKIKLLGVIGYSVLKDYEIFIDLYLNQITLTKVDKYGNKLNPKVYLEKITDSLNFSLINHTIVLNAIVNHQKLRFGLDTAAEFNQINKTINKNALKYFIPKQRLSLQGAGHRSIKVLAGKLHRVKLSDKIYCGPMNTVLTNLSKMNEAFGVDLDGVLGYEFFVQQRTIINYQKEKLYFINYPLNYH